MAKLVARDAGWCRHYGTDGKSKDRERRAIKRSDRNRTKKDLRKDLAN
jgi:hypothetical protein